ncbi:B12-binding domain-containing protein [Chloroflexota bacterium]
MTETSKLIEAVIRIEEGEALRIVQEKINLGEDPYDIMNSCQEAMKIVGQKFEKKEYFVPELVMSGELIKEISEILKPNLEAAQQTTRGEGKRGKVVLGTVYGDIHDIGKDIVKFMLDVNGFDVTDLGVDVPEDNFVEAVKKVQPQVVALSGLLTLAYDSMKSTVEALRKAGLREKVKIMIGGGQTNETIKDYVKADAYGGDAMAAVRLANEWIPAK